MSGSTPPELHRRLINWAVCVRVTEKQGVSPTGAFCDDLARRAGQGVTAETERGPRLERDEDDAHRVELAWRRCMPRNKDLLLWFYVHNSKPAFICRRLRIPARPESIFELRRYHAESEIARFLEQDPGVTFAPHASR